MAPSDYVFRAMSAADLPLLRRWLERPHFVEWWGDPDEQFELVKNDLDEPAMDQFLVATEDRPFAYLQCYDPADWPAGGLGPLPGGARGMDQFIGEADMISRGHGSAMIRAFAERLLRDGASRVVTDPAPANARAIRACEKAGFRRDRMVSIPDGAVLLMVRDT